MSFIRAAKVEDLDRIIEIHNQAIKTRQCTCETEPFTLENRKPWFESHKADKHPIFVHICNGHVVAFAGISAHRIGWQALDCVGEICFFVDEHYHRRGIGSGLLRHVIHHAKALKFKHLIAIVLQCNHASIALIEKHGFRIWGRLPHIAYFGDACHSQLYYGLDLERIDCSCVR